MILAIFSLCLAMLDPPEEVAPADLARRADLAGREVVVDGRLAYFQSHEGIFDELYLKKTPIAFRLPPSLQSKHNPEGQTARIQGTLKKENVSLVVDVTSLRMLPADLDRLKQGVGLLSASDAEGRFAWARWARYRGKEYGEETLLERAGELDAEAIRIEAERPTAKSATGALRLAKKARDLGIPEPEPGALAHRGFQSRLGEARTAADLEALTKEIESLLPNSLKPSFNNDLKGWDASDRADPAAAYRMAPPPIRAALDRRLWADAEASFLTQSLAENPDVGLAIADQAHARLADRPEFADRLEKQALKRATDDDHLHQLRRDEIESLARRYESRGQPGEAQLLKRQWLEEQRRRRLRPGDAEGRLLLAGQFESILGDRESAIALLREAWAIDPQSKDIAAAFRRLGFRKVGDDWEPASLAPASKSKSGETKNSPQPKASEDLFGDSLRNLTRQEVRLRIGEPARIIRSATLAGVLEQWIYPGTRRTQFVNFYQRTGMPQPLVQRSYSIGSP